MARGRISRFPIDLRRRPYNTLALPCECVMNISPSWSWAWRAVDDTCNSVSPVTTAQHRQHWMNIDPRVDGVLTLLTGMGSRQFCRGRGRGRGRGEARQRQRARGRGEEDYIRGKAEARRPPEKPSFPYMYSNTKFGRFKSNCMT